MAREALRIGAHTATLSAPVFVWASALADVPCAEGRVVRTAREAAIAVAVAHVSCGMQSGELHTALEQRTAVQRILGRAQTPARVYKGVRAKHSSAHLL